MATQASANAPNRMSPLIGGILMNFCLGTSYAWSVFVLPLENEFGWSRTETSITVHDHHHQRRVMVRGSGPAAGPIQP